MPHKTGMNTVRHGDSFYDAIDLLDSPESSTCVSVDRSISSPGLIFRHPSTHRKAPMAVPNDEERRTKRGGSACSGSSGAGRGGLNPFSGPHGGRAYVTSPTGKAGAARTGARGSLTRYEVAVHKASERINAVDAGARLGGGRAPRPWCALPPGLNVADAWSILFPSRADAERYFVRNHIPVTTLLASTDEPPAALPKSLLESASGASLPFIQSRTELWHAISGSSAPPSAAAVAEVRQSERGWTPLGPLPAFFASWNASRSDRGGDTEPWGLSLTTLPSATKTVANTAAATPAHKTPTQELSITARGATPPSPPPEGGQGKPAADALIGIRKRATPVLQPQLLMTGGQSQWLSSAPTNAHPDAASDGWVSPMTSKRPRAVRVRDSLTETPHRPRLSVHSAACTPNASSNTGITATAAVSGHSANRCTGTTGDAAAGESHSAFRSVLAELILPGSPARVLPAGHSWSPLTRPITSILQTRAMSAGATAAKTNAAAATAADSESHVPSHPQVWSPMWPTPTSPISTSLTSAPVVVFMGEYSLRHIAGHTSHFRRSGELSQHSAASFSSEEEVLTRPSRSPFRGAFNPYSNNHSEASTSRERKTTFTMSSVSFSDDVLFGKRHTAPKAGSLGSYVFRHQLFRVRSNGTLTDESSSRAEDSSRQGSGDSARAGRDAPVEMSFLLHGDDPIVSGDRGSTVSSTATSTTSGTPIPQTTARRATVAGSGRRSGVHNQPALHAVLNHGRVVPRPPRIHVSRDGSDDYTENREADDLVEASLAAGSSGDVTSDDLAATQRPHIGLPVPLLEPVGTAPPITLNASQAGSEECSARCASGVRAGGLVNSEAQACRPPSPTAAAGQQRTAAERECEEEEVRKFLAAAHAQASAAPRGLSSMMTAMVRSSSWSATLSYGMLSPLSSAHLDASDWPRLPCVSSNFANACHSPWGASQHSYPSSARQRQTTTSGDESSTAEATVEPPRAGASPTSAAAVAMRMSNVTDSLLANPHTHAARHYRDKAGAALRTTIASPTLPPGQPSTVEGSTVRVPGAPARSTGTHTADSAARGTASGVHALTAGSAMPTGSAATSRTVCDGASAEGGEGSASPELSPTRPSCLREPRGGIPTMPLNVHNSLPRGAHTPRGQASTLEGACHQVYSGRGRLTSFDASSGSPVQSGGGGVATDGVHFITFIEDNADMVGRGDDPSVCAGDDRAADRSTRPQKIHRHMPAHAYGGAPITKSPDGWQHRERHESISGESGMSLHSSLVRGVVSAASSWASADRGRGVVTFDEDNPCVAPPLHQDDRGNEKHDFPRSGISSTSCPSSGSIESQLVGHADGVDGRQCT